VAAWVAAEVCVLLMVVHAPGNVLSDGRLVTSM